MFPRRLVILLAVSALLVLPLRSASTQATSVDVGRTLLQLGGDSKGVGNLLDNCSGYSAEQLLNFLAGVISGSTTPPQQLLTDTQPNNCNANGLTTTPAKNQPPHKGRRLSSAPNDRKLLQFNKICAGLQCLETAITARLGASGTPANKVTQTIVNYCDNNIDGPGTATVGQVYNEAVKLFPRLAKLDATITTELSPFCAAPVGK